nr:zincin-like metallopeptidase domain-containing protein [Cyanobium sp. Morenito 9A2]
MRSKELVAELGAVLLGDRLEIGSEIESHAAYLGHWIELLKESPKVLFQVLSEARQAADLICPEALEKMECQGEAPLPLKAATPWTRSLP